MGVNVTACLVTRGQEIDMDPILESLPAEWEVVLWMNGVAVWRWASNANRWRSNSGQHFGYAADLSVYGRYAAIDHASHDLIYVQDDDVIVGDPQAIVDVWLRERDHLIASRAEGFNAWSGHVVCNMPPEFRHGGYHDSALVGFGACFYRDAAERAFDRWRNREWRCGGCNGLRSALCSDCEAAAHDIEHDEFFLRECDTVLTMLTPRVLIDVPKIDREFASDPDRLWKQTDHSRQRERMRDLVRRVRDSA